VRRLLLARKSLVIHVRREDPRLRDTRLRLGRAMGDKGIEQDDVTAPKVRVDSVIGEREVLHNGIAILDPNTPIEHPTHGVVRIGIRVDVGDETERNRKGTAVWRQTRVFTLEYLYGLFKRVAAAFWEKARKRLLHAADPFTNDR